LPHVIEFLRPEARGNLQRPVLFGHNDRCAGAVLFAHSSPMIRNLVQTSAMISELAVTTKDAALKELLAAAGKAGAFPESAHMALGKRLSDREAIGSTGLGNGVAVPHVKGEDVKGVSLVMARCRSGLEWQAIDGRPVHVFFMLVSPTNEPEAHLQCLRWIASLARNSDFRRFLLDADGEEAMRDLLLEMSGKE
jgi:mannitol/fructose-specific phosphotransferase system IIA component (Ntr-type)